MNMIPTHIIRFQSSYYRLVQQEHKAKWSVLMPKFSYKASVTDNCNSKINCLIRHIQHSRVSQVSITYQPVRQFSLSAVKPNSSSEISNSKNVSSDFATNEFLPPDEASAVTEATSDGSLQVESLADYGLGGWDAPQHVIQSVLEYLHLNLDASWISSIIISTVLLRLTTIPAYIRLRSFNIRSLNYFPEQNRLQMAVFQSRDKDEQEENKEKYVDFLKEKQLNPVIPFLLQFPTIIIFISYFSAFHEIAVAKVPSLVNGGALWFTDLTIADPYYLLPVLACISMHLVIRFGGASSVELGPASHIPSMKRVILWSPIALIPLVAFQPSSIFIFWMTSNAYSWLQSRAFSIPQIQKICGIPQLVEHSKAEKAEMKNFAEYMRKQVQSHSPQTNKNQTNKSRPRQ